MHDGQPAAYLRRIVDGDLDEILVTSAAVSIEGPRAVGKTATALQRAASVHLLDNPSQLAVLRSDPSRILTEPGPVLIDEWQLMPTVWDVVRRAVDAGSEPGRFILTGSANPRDARIHTGAGRIIDLHMRSMTLPERGATIPSVSLAALLAGDRPTIAGNTDFGIAEYVAQILRSGLPGLLRLPDAEVERRLRGYVNRIVDRELPALGVGSRSRAALLAWMKAYASAVSGTAAYESIRDAATPGRAAKPSRETAERYLNALEDIWVVNPIEAWRPTHSPMGRLGTRPKHQMFDPGIVGYLLGESGDSILGGAPAGRLLPRAATVMGALFEAQVAHDLAVYAQAAGAELRHFREHNGDHEIDLVVERRDGRVLAIEVKLTQVPNSADVKHLRWLQETIGDRLVDAIVITTGRVVYRRPEDGIVVVPLALLGP